MACKPLRQGLATPWRERRRSLAPNQPRWEMNGAYDKTARGWGGHGFSRALRERRSDKGRDKPMDQASPLGSANGAGVDASADRRRGGGAVRARDKDTRI
jgi:hypothetical protein